MLRRKKRKSNQGSFLAIAFLVSVLVAIVVIAIARSIQSISNDSTHLDNMSRVFRLAETGLNDAVGQLTIKPTAYQDDATFSAHVGPPSEYFSHHANKAGFMNDGYYVWVEAVHIVGGRIYSTILHSQVRISNTAEYFWAVNSDLYISPGANAPTGKVYAERLFLTGAANSPSIDLKTAEYHMAISPPDTDTRYGTNILLYGAVNNKPKNIPSGLIFPQVLYEDMVRFNGLAHDTMNNNPTTFTSTASDKCDFTGHIYPPGYDADFPHIQNDPYASDDAHTSENADHVYYCHGDMTIGPAIVHGQVLFVAEGNIYIRDSLTSFSLDTIASDPIQFSTSGDELKSTAHQAVLVTRGSVIIDNTFVNAPPAGVVTETIQAFVMAPDGQLSYRTYPDDTYHNMLQLNFTGSMVLGQIDNGSFSASAVFKAGRSYSYMTSLETYPPPYIPAIAEVEYSFEETTHAGDPI